MNEKCSILIPTYNRPVYLRRTLSYYNEYGRDFRIVVADSSSDENKKRNKKFISPFSNLKILHLSNYSSELNLFHKIADAIKYIEEKYCVLCADDDFITPNGINQSVNFLEKNADFTVAHGYYIAFYLKTNKKAEQQFLWKPIYPYKSITFPDAKSRLFFHLSNYYPTIYGVHRTKFLNMIFKETMKFTNDLRFGELLPSMLTLIYGKMKRLDVFYAARESIPGSTGKTTPKFKHFIKGGTYDEKYAKFGDCLSIHLNKKSKLDVEESRRVVDSVMSVYLSTSLITNYKRTLMDKIKSFLVYSRLPDWIDEEIRTLYRRLFPTKQMQMDDFRSSVDYDDLDKIRRFALFYSVQIMA